MSQQSISSTGSLWVNITCGTVNLFTARYVMAEYVAATPATNPMNNIS